MAILDNDLVVSDAQALTATAGSTNIIDLNVTGRKIGAGEPIVFEVYIDVAADGTTTDETYTFGLQTDDDVAFGSATTLDTVTLTYAQMTLNSKHTLLFRPEFAGERYVRLYYTLGGTTPSVTLTAALQPLNTVVKKTEYPNAYTITH